MTSVPAQMRSLRTQDGKKAGIETVPVPQPKENEVLIKVKTVTLNPTDWKSVAWLAPPGNGVGCDAYGTVVKLGPNLKADVKVGDNIAFFEMGSFYSPDKGTFSEYATTQADTAVIVPDKYDPAEASSFGIGGYTAIMTVFERLRIPNLPKDLSAAPELNSSSPKLLIWAASTSVGQFAVQFGRLAGYHVIATGSSANHAYLKELGASDTFDYKDSTTPEQIAKKYPDLALAVDCFSEKGSTVAVAKSLSAKGGKVITILPIEAAAKEARPDVDFESTLAYTLLGRSDFQFGNLFQWTDKSVKEDNEYIKPWVAGRDSIVNNLFAKGLIRGNKIAHRDGGIDKITEGMAYLKDGKAQLEKLAYTIA
ncbi:unnamed protein product [Parajaminaea phylloscopi]